MGHSVHPESIGGDAPRLASDKGGQTGPA
jgi:hypothetical protein